MPRATYNYRSLLQNEQVFNLGNETRIIEWDIIGISEVRRKREGLLMLKSGNVLFYKGHEIESRGRGVGFLIKEALIPNIENTREILERVAYITIKINEGHKLKLIQVCLPTSTHTDEDIELVYVDIRLAREQNKCRYDLVMEL